MRYDRHSESGTPANKPTIHNPSCRMGKCQQYLQSCRTKLANFIHCIIAQRLDNDMIRLVRTTPSIKRSMVFFSLMVIQNKKFQRK